MDFAFNDEQLMIRDTATAFLQNNSDSAAVRKAMASPLGYDPALWQSLCQDMYWQALHLPESVGGMGLGYVELVAIMEQMGASLLCAPYFSSVVLAANALLVCAESDRAAPHLAAIVEGQTASLAFTNSSEFSLSGIDASARREGEQYVINGSYQHVIDGASCETLIVAAKDQDSGELLLFALAANQPGIERIACSTMDQTRRRARLIISNLRVDESACLCIGDVSIDFQAVLDLACIALAAEQVGVMQETLDKAVAYTKERQQFNRPIASFQAIKHLAADMMLRTEVGRSAIYYAACVADDYLSGNADALTLAEAASVAKAWCSDAAFRNAGDALQMHGGVGFTWEYDIHLYFKRAKASEHLFGSAERHRERIASMLLDDVG